MQRNGVELLGAESAVAAHGRRPARPRPRASRIHPPRRSRGRRASATGSAPGRSSRRARPAPRAAPRAPGKRPCLLPELALERTHEALAAPHPAAGEQPDLAARLHVPEEQDAPAPAEDRRNADPRLPHAQLADDPNPREPRSLVASSSTSTSRTEATGTMTSWAMRIPGLDGERLARVGVQEHDQHLPAVAGVDEAGRVDDADPVARGEPRTRLHEPRVSLRDLDGDPGRDDGALARLERDLLARSEVEPGVTRRRPGSAAPRPRAAGGLRRRSPSRASAPDVGHPALRRRGTREPRHLPPRQPRADPHPFGVSRRSAIGAPRPYSARQRAAVLVGTSRRTSSKRSEKSSATRSWSSRGPRPSRPRPGAPAGTRDSTAAVPAGRGDRPCSARARPARRRLRSRKARRGRRRSSPASRSSGSEPSTTWSTRSATSVSSRVAANPSTSWVGSRRMNPTVSVTRYRLPSCSNPRVVGSSVSKSRSSTEASAPVSAFSSVDLPDVRVPGERDRRHRRPARAPCGASPAAAPSPRRRRLRSETRFLREPSVGLELLSPGPRVPTPPPRRSRCCHIPRMRGRLYSSCASSTWSFPSALRACWAKMSRISCVRSTTRALSASSSDAAASA